jgi:hypothetical protein
MNQNRDKKYTTSKHVQIQKIHVTLSLAKTGNLN